MVDPAATSRLRVDQNRFLRPLAQAGVTVLRHDVVTDPAPEGPFDLIHVRHVLEHLPSRDELIRKLAPWLSEGGWLVVEAGFHIPGIAGHSAQARQKTARAQLLADKIGTDLAWATTLPAPLVAAGLADIQVQGSLRLSPADVDEALELYENPAFVDYSQGAVSTWGRR